METIKQDINQDLSFTDSDGQISALLQKLHELSDLEALMALTDWDQQTALPPGANEQRGHQMATLKGILHDRWTASELGDLLTRLLDRVEEPSFTEADRGLIRWSYRAYDRATRLPRTLVEEIERAHSASTEAWIRARANKDFALFAPALRQTIRLQQELADRLGYQENRYDALLDESEPGLTTARIEELFTPVREVSTSLLKRIQASGRQIDNSYFEQNFAVKQQEHLCEHILRVIGYDFTYGQLARSTHPFTTSLGSPDDVRLTVRYQENQVQMALMTALHEGGHGLYEQGQSRSLKRTPLASGASMGTHESQSRLWENTIGRSLSFWQGQYSRVQAFFPQQLGTLDVKDFVRALNKVEPNPIRTEADEVTYNLHIIIRFELEKAMVNGEINVESLPTQWNEKYRSYLDIEPENDVKGILQDIHWTSGFGYFPSYTLGNLYAAQIYQTLHKAFPDADKRLSEGDTSFILQWLQKHMYRLGAIYRPNELMERVTGEAATPRYFTQYLTSKFSTIYGLTD